MYGFMKYLCVIWTLILWVSCQRGENIKSLEEMFVDSQELTHERPLSDDMVWGSPAFLHYVDSSVVVYDNTLDSIFTLIDVRNPYEFLRFGKKGQGVNEFLQPFSFQNIGEGYRMGVYDVFKHSLFSIDLNAVKAREKESFPLIVRDSMNSINIIPTIYNTFIGIGFYENELFRLFNDKGSLKSFFEYPYRDEVERQIPNRVRGMAYQGSVKSNPAMTKLVYAVRTAPIVFFYNINEDGINKKCQYAFAYPEYKTEVSQHSMSAPQSAENKMGFIDSYATDQYVYLLYSGKSYKDMKTKAFEGSVIYVFDWDGKPVKRLILDIPIKILCVSADNSIIYGFADIPEPTFLEFKINQ